jgi:hypothetical protein
MHRWKPLTGKIESLFRAAGCLTNEKKKLAIVITYKTTSACVAIQNPEVIALNFDLSRELVNINNQAKLSFNRSRGFQTIEPVADPGGSQAAAPHGWTRKFFFTCSHINRYARPGLTILNSKFHRISRFEQCNFVQFLSKINSFL